MSTSQLYSAKKVNIYINSGAEDEEKETTVPQMNFDDIINKLRDINGKCDELMMQRRNYMRQHVIHKPLQIIFFSRYWRQNIYGDNYWS